MFGENRSALSIWRAEKESKRGVKTKKNKKSRNSSVSAIFITKAIFSWKNKKYNKYVQ